MLSVLLLVSAGTLGLVSIKRIPEGMVYTLRRLDGQIRTLRSGTHVVIPLFERVIHRISLTGHALSIEAQLPCADRSSLALRGMVYWQVLDPVRADAVIERAEELIRARALDGLREVDVSESEAPETRNARLKQTLNEALRERGVLVTRVQLAAF